MNTLETFGWNNTLGAAWHELGLHGMIPARVIADYGTSLRIATPEIISAELSGRLAHYESREKTPKVGDWVAVRLSDNGHAVIESVMPRRSEVARKSAGKKAIKQTIAANIDIAFVLLALDGDFSVERVRRFLFQLSINNIASVIVLNKADKTDDLDSFISQVAPFNLPIVTTTASQGKGIDELMKLISPGKTAILLGSSGVGKSTITNQLLGRDQQATREIRASDDTGRHTTVHRELFVLPGGGLLVDTPGIRELQLWGTEEDLYGNFDDIVQLTRQCAFSTCRHGSEDGCAVQKALSEQLLTSEKYAAFIRMQHELRHVVEKDRERIKRTNAKSKRSLAKQDRDVRREMHDELY